VADTAEQIRQRYNRQVEEIRARRDLSDDGRKRQLAAAKVTADAQFRTIRERDAADLDIRRTGLVHRLFGRTSTNGADALSVRDALTRASAAKTPSDAENLLRMARLSGDDVLGRAVAAHAYDRVRSSLGGSRQHWGQILSEWAGGDGPTADSVGELLAIDGVGDRGSQIATAQVMDRLFGSAVRPRELDGANIGQLAREADADPGRDDPPPMPGSRFFS
jgi:hypothetical protein